MKKYKYLQLSWSEHGVVVSLADIQLWEWIVAETKKYIPSFRAGPISEYKFPTGESWAYRLYQLQGKDYNVAHWILNQLCLQGWEPFAVTARLSNGSSLQDIYHLRFEVT